MTTDETQTDGGTATEDRSTSPAGQFHPTDVANIIEDGVSQVTTRRFGAFVAMAYGHLTDLLFLGLWAGSVYLFTYSLDFVSYSRNLALITITIGTFVLMAGANLIDKFGEQAVNFRAYIHNSITFITSGIAFLLGFLSRQIVENYTFESPLSLLAEAWLLVLNIVASFLFLLSVWVLLKLLWRLDRLISQEDQFHKTAEVYGEFRESIEGLSADRPQQDEDSESRAILGLLLTGITILLLGGLPYLATGQYRWSLLVLGVGYAGYAGIQARRGEL